MCERTERGRVSDEYFQIARQRINLAEITSYNVIAPESANDSGAFSGYGMGFYLVLTLRPLLFVTSVCTVDLLMPNFAAV
jgi:hypothetical protein